MMPDAVTSGARLVEPRAKARTTNKAAASTAPCRRTPGAMRRPKGVSANSPARPYTAAEPMAASATSANPMPRTISSSGSVKM